MNAERPTMFKLVEIPRIFTSIYVKTMETNTSELNMYGVFSNLGVDLHHPGCRHLEYLAPHSDIIKDHYEILKERSKNLSRTVAAEGH